MRNRLINPLLRAAATPFRYGIVTRRRGAMLRNLCTMVIKIAAKTGAARGQDEIRALDAPQLSFEACNSMVMDAIYWYGIQGYEGRVADVWVSLCAHARSILEIGANVGLFSVIGARATSAHYTAVEPVPWVAGILRANLRRNGLLGVEVLEGAVIPGTEDAPVTLNVPEENRGAPVGAHLTGGVEVSGRGTQRSLTVTGFAMARLAQGHDLIKIDAEGIEADLLTSTRDTLITNCPTLLIEVLPEAKRLGEVAAALARDAGYRIFVLPEYGSDTIVEVKWQDFDAATPRRYCSKDIVLCKDMLDLPPPGPAAIFG